MVKNDNVMYFPENYIENELKDFLLTLEIVKEIKRPDAFKDIKEDEFLKFIKEELKIPSNFSWIENNDFNPWTKSLIEKGTNEENQELYKLIDLMIFDKFLSEKTDIEEVTKYCLPILCRQEENLSEKYRKPSEGENLIWVKNDKEIEKFKDLICDSKYNEEYLNWLEVKELNDITPENFILKNEEYELEFWKWVYKHSNNSDLPEKLVVFLNKQLNTFDMLIEFLEKGDRYNKIMKMLELSQRFLLDIIKEKDINNNSPVELLGSVIADYLETVNKCSKNNESLKISCSDPNEIEIKEIKEEIQKEIQFHDKYDEISNWIKNIIVVGEKSEKSGYAKLAESKLALPCQKDKRKYRECISDFLKNEYNISLDKRTYTMTAIDNTCAIKVSEISEEEFKDLKIENLKWSGIGDDENKKRLLMEPYLYKNKYIQGYGRTCPLCGKVVITEITTMRIKTIVKDDKRYDFLCCSSCADLFFYCDNQPELVGLENLGEIDKTIKLEFYIEPHFLNQPYTVEFKPRPLHRKILLEQRGDE